MRSSLDEMLKATRLEYLKLQGEEKALEESETLAKGWEYPNLVKFSSFQLKFLTQ